MKNAEPRVVRTPYRVIYADTDQMGMVYHGNYLSLFERGRVEFLRSAGVSHAEIEDKGYLIPVVDAHVKYRRPARYEDLLIIETRITKVGRVKLVFEYRILRDDTAPDASADPPDDGEETLIAYGTTVHGCLDRALRPARIPPRFGPRMMYLGAQRFRLEDHPTLP